MLRGCFRLTCFHLFVWRREGDTIFAEAASPFPIHTFWNFFFENRCHVSTQGPALLSSFCVEGF